jgi:uncharacterized protein
MQANIISLVAEGVFEAFPTLKLVSVENGFGWIPSLMRRLDNAWTLLRSEVPQVKRPPSQYVREHVWLMFTSQLLEQFGDMTSHILFASDYPHWDSDNPDTALPPYLPKPTLDAIYFENARALYGL